MQKIRYGSKHFGQALVPGKGWLLVSYKTIVGVLPTFGPATFTARSYSTTTDSHINGAIQAQDKRAKPRTFAKLVQSWGFDASINAAPVEF